MKCRFPIGLTAETGATIYVPCGKCAWCKSRIRDEWVFRLQKEMKEHLMSSFVTLTYDEEHLPFTVNNDGVMVPTVSKIDVTSYHKLLRKNGNHFRFFICSEYGKKNLRPHYHGIYFHNEPIDFAKHWHKGEEVAVLPASTASMKYVLKYTLKGSVVPEGAEPNFRLMSRRPGIGAGFQFYYKGTPYVYDEHGVQCSVPTYYKRNYLNSLDEKIKNMVKSSKIEYLSSSIPHSSLMRIYKDSTHLDPQNDLVAFETWLSDLYKMDYVKQLKINDK